MAECASGRRSCIPESHRICDQNTQLSVRRACVISHGLYRWAIGMEWQNRTWTRNLVRTTRKPVESYLSGVLVCVCQSSRVSVHSIALVHETRDLVSLSLAG